MLVMYQARRRDAAVRVADLIPGARAVQMPGEDLGVWVGKDVPQEIERLLGGHEPIRVADSILTTVLFTDVVGSTTRASELGDHAWRSSRAAPPNRAPRLARFRGNEVDMAGDGFFGSFDRPARAIRCGCLTADPTC